MATLQEQRRAIAAGMAARRAPTGEAERKAIGKRMIEERTGKSVAEDLNRLAAPQQQRRSLPGISSVGALPASVGRATYKAPAAAATAGIASPLVEIDTADGAPAGEAGREYYPDHYSLYSSDYLIALEIRPLKTLRMTDLNGDAVELQFKKPPQP